MYSPIDEMTNGTNDCRYSESKQSARIELDSSIQSNPKSKGKGDYDP